MLGDDLPFDFDKRDETKKHIPKKESIVSERELNPYYRKGSESALSRKSTTQSIEWTSVLVKRAIKMIESGEKTFENAAIDRFGSADAFEDAIRQVERHERIKLNIRIHKFTDIKEEVKANETTNTRTTSKSISNSVSNAYPLSQDDINKLIAKKMKAELSDDFETSRRLEEEIKKYHEKPKEKLTLLPSETYNKRKAEKNMTIAEMVRHEKLTSFKEFDRELERGISGNKRFKDDLDTLDEQVSIDHEHELKSGKSNTFDCRARSIDEFRNRERITKECWFCPDSDRFKQERASDWIVARGHYTYLSIPKTRSIHPLHCLIVPTSHSCSLLDCQEFEEEIWEEVRNFKKCLLQLAAKQDRSFVFMECVMKVGDARRHTFIDCIPTPRGQYAEHVKGHFLKALQESESEWSQNKKVIDTSAKTGGLRSALPRKHFPYFYVDFRLDQGYAHVIEDPEKFSGDFGRDIMASVLGVSRNEWRISRTSVDEYKRFSVLFQPFDWTKSIE